MKMHWSGSVPAVCPISEIPNYFTLLAINLQIINDYAGPDPGLPTVGTEPGQH